MTNREIYINDLEEMTDEEFAEEMSRITDCRECPISHKCFNQENCADYFLDWINMEG